MRVLVLVTGTGRSGTSTAAGALHHLGLDVPGPYLRANESNPRGFYESRWAVRFHNQLITRAGIGMVDARPIAADRIQAALRAADHRRLDSYLARHEHADQLVVKDPRSVWVLRAWADAAARNGREVRFLSMLRHPAEVVRSRNTYYSQAGAGEKSRRQSTLNLMRWVNTSLVNERGTRGAVRSFAVYPDLIADWRGTLGRVGDELGLVYDPPVDVRPHPVDDFVDPSLRRHDSTWDDLAVPDELREVAAEIWAAEHRLAEDPAAAPTVHAALDAVGARYATLVETATLLSQEDQQESYRRGRQRGMKEAAGVEASLDALSTRELAAALRHRAAGRVRRSLSPRSGADRDPKGTDR